jgi:hypothetical protein
MLNTRAVIAGSTLLVLAGTAFGQASTTAATLTYSLTWQDTGNHNEVLEVGEAAVLRLTVTMSPAVNTVIPFTGGFGGPTGTLRAVVSGFIDLTGAGGTQGMFNVDPAAGYGLDPTWDLVGPGGQGTPNGTGVINIQFGQWPGGVNGWNTTNPIVDIWTVAWTPASYAPRAVTFGTAGSVAAGLDVSMVLIKWGPLNGNVQATRCLSSFGSLEIPIVPTPSGLGLLVLGGVIACARARRRSC